MTETTCIVEVGVRLPRRTSGQVILVISGQSRMMYQSLKPEPEGAIFAKRSMPQETNSSPHDARASIANWPESTIQGNEVQRDRRWGVGTLRTTCDAGELSQGDSPREWGVGPRDRQEDRCQGHRALIPSQRDDSG